MYGKYPIIIDGKTVGELTVKNRGIMTEFCARCEDSGELIRLSVYGENEGYLGVMLPENGELSLKKSFSRLAMRDFPKQILFAGPSGMGGISVPEIENQAEESGLPVMIDDEKKQQKEEQGIVPMFDDTDITWHRDGAYALRAQAADGTELYAVPVGTPGLPEDKPLPIRIIDGNEYSVLKIKNGKIL